jgi:hypothetical protein
MDDLRTPEHAERVEAEATEAFRRRREFLQRHATAGVGVFECEAVEEP